MLVIIKLIELTGIISKHWIYYAEHNNTKYYFISQYRDVMPAKRKRTHQTIQQNLIKLIKNQNWLGAKLINWGSSRPTKWIHFTKRLENATLYKQYGIRQKKRSPVSEI